jgi:TetR/AcrR family transcriptional regulator, transcriptional repressor for nem operon
MSDNREKIVECALLLLKQRGYSGWSYDHIAKKLGIRKASIHYYFPTKEDLIDKALDQYIDSFFQTLENKTQHLKSCREKLKGLFAIYKKTSDSKDEICLCTMMASDFFTLSDRIKLRLEKFYARLREWISSQIAKEGKSGDPQKKADLVVNVLQGLMVTSKVLDDNNQFNNCMSLLIE